MTRDGLSGTHTGLVMIGLRFGVFGVKDFSPIKMFLNFGLSSIWIFADLVRVWITHLNYF